MAWRLLLRLRLWLAGLTLLALSAACAEDSATTRPTDHPQNGVSTAKILVVETGFYRLPLGRLARVGLAETDLATGNFSLTLGGAEIAYLLLNDSLIFYGQAPASRYAPYAAYVVALGRPGQRMATALAPLADGQPLAAVSYTAHFEENMLYDSRASAVGDEAPKMAADEPWFWKTIQVNQKVELTFELPASPTALPATLEVALRGISHNDQVELDHDLDVLINDALLGAIRFDGGTAYLARLAVPAGLLRQGTNSLVLDNSAAGAALVDISHLDWFEIQYQARPQLIDGRLRLSNVSGVVSSEEWPTESLIFDLGAPERPQLWQEWQQAGGSAHLALSATTPVEVVTPDGFLSPSAVVPWQPGQWASPNQAADLIIITPQAFAPHLEPLVAARQEQELRVVVVPVEELYDEFGGGTPGPEAIQAFVGYAVEQWRPPQSRYLLLVGEATYDYRGYLEGGPDNVVPAPMVRVDYSGETVSDNRLADVDGDAVPDLAVGRWPVDDADQVARLVERTLAYERRSAASSALFAVDPSSLQFAAFNRNLLQAAAFPAEAGLTLQGPAVSQLADRWNSGAWLLAYVGHGSLDRWGKSNLFANEAVAQLDQEAAGAIVLHFTCLSGYFAHPELNSLAEELLLSDNGPALQVASTGLTLSNYQYDFAVNLLRQLQDPAVVRIGDALLAAKQSLDIPGNKYLREIADVFGLIGDPSARISRPAAFVE